MGTCSVGGGELLRRAPAFLPFLLLALALSSLNAAAQAPTPAGLQVSISASPSTATLGQTVAFTSTVSGEASPTWVHYNWSFGDRQWFNGTGPAWSHPGHYYETTGTFVASVNASEQGSSDTQAISVTVAAAPLTVTATATPLQGTAPLTVVFDGSVSGGTGTYPSEIWSFGDGHNGSGLVVPYTYTQAGSFDAVLEVTDSAGSNSSAHVLIVVNAPATPPGWQEALSTWVPWATTAAAVIVAALAAYRARTASARHRRAEEKLALAAAAAPSAGTLPPPASGPSPDDQVEGAKTAPPSSASPRSPRSEEVPTPTGLPSPEGTPPAPPATPAPGPTLDTPAVPPDATPVAPTTPEAPSEGSPDEGTPTPAPRAPRRPAVPTETLRLSLRIVVHIAAQGALGPHDVAPAALTQAGMAETFGAKQNTIATILKRLEVAGVVVSDVRHVRGGARRMKVYRLTPRGEVLAKEVRSRPSPNRSRAGSPPEERSGP